MATRPTGTDADIFRALVEDGSDAIALVDAAGIVRFASRSSERILGHAPEERVGRSAFELVHPEDLTRVNEAFSRCLVEPGAAFTSEFRVRHRDGAWLELEASAINRLHHPAVEGIVVTYRDITERRRAEEELRRSETHYRSLVQHAPYGIYQSTVDGRLLDANATFAQMLGYDTVDQVLALNMRDVYERPEEREELIRRHRGDLGETPPSGVTWRKKDGTRLTVRIKARSVQHAHDGQSCFQGVVEDITERRVLEEQLRQSQKMEAVGRLARGIAHDFNNVLAAILGCAGLLQLRAKPGDPFYEDAEEIARAAERGAELTRQLLAFSRRQAVVPEVLDVHAVLRAFERMLQRLSNGIAITLATPGPAPKVRAERGQIEQIVMNLIVNASDATPADGSIEIDARIKTLGAQEALRFPDLPPGRYARIAVHDTGTGIEPEAQRHVFEPFFTTKDPSKGTGLGLSIVYGIAKEAGGAVTFTSSAAEGTTFEVLLPLVEDPERAGT
jgi:PAS domain S-box-containing protein